MTILITGHCAGLLLWTLSVLSLENVFASPGFGYTLTMPLDSFRTYEGRAKRSLATICVEIKPNGPLEEPYYMCKGADFPQFPKLTGVGNMATANYNSATGTSDISVKQSAPPIAPNIQYNGASFSGERSVANGEHFHNYPNEFITESKAGRSEHETAKSIPQQSKQTTNVNVVNSQPGQQIQFNAGGTTKPFNEQASAGAIYQKPNEQYQKHIEHIAEYHQLPISHPQQQQHYQKQVHHQQLPQNQQQQSVTPPGQNFQSAFQAREQFFRPGTKSESHASTEKHNGYDSIYSDGGSGAAPKQNSDFIPSAAYGAQHTATFGNHPAAPTFESTAAGARSSLATHANQRFESPQYVSHGTAGCGEDCGESLTQATSPNGATPDGAAQYAAKSTIHNSGYDEQGPNSFVAGGGSPQHGYAHPTIHPSISVADVQDSPNVPSTYYPPAAVARTPTTSPFRYGDSGASAFTTDNGFSVPNLGPDDTRLHGSTSLRPLSNAAHFSNAKNPFDRHFGARYSQATHPQSVQVQHENTHFPHFHHENKHSPTQNIPPALRYRSMIGDEVLQMPNWGFSTDELDLYRSVSSEDEDKKNKMTSMLLPAPAPTPKRMIPLEYLEDPVLRTFYSSLDDVELLPKISPAYPPNQIQPPTAYNRPLPRRAPYQVPPQRCSYQPAPQYYNYNPCPLQRDYNFQPVFIALPCYGQSIYPTLGSPAQGAVTGNPITHLVSSIQTQTELQTPHPQADAPKTSTNFAASKSESATIIGSTRNVQADMILKAQGTTTTEATTTKADSNESSETLEDSTPTVAKAIQSKIKSDIVNGSAELKLSSLENPTIVNFDTNLQDIPKVTPDSPIALVEKLGTSTSAITPSSVDSIGGEMDSEMSTTFKSLILTARKLAQMVTTSQEEEDAIYKDEVSTSQPVPKKARHVSRSSSNSKGNGGNK